MNSAKSGPDQNRGSKIESTDLIRSDVNRIYKGFNRDCGKEAELLARPRVTRPTDANDFVRLSIDEEQGEGFWDLLRVQDGLMLCVADGKYAARSNYFVSPPVDIITLRLIVSGDLELSGEASDNIHFQRGNVSLLSVPKDTDHEIHIGEDDPLSSVTLHFHAARFNELLGFDEDGVAPGLLPLFGDEDAVKYCTLPMSARMGDSVQDLVTAPFSGVLRRRYFEAKALEIMCLFMDAVQNPAPDLILEGSVGVDYLEAVKRARKTLAENVAAPPTVSELAKLVGVNRTQLRRDFKRLFGVTIRDFLLEQRMEIAHSLLTKHAMSVQAVAEKVGYQHAGNFTAAFHRFYGILPKSLKTRQNAR